MIQKICVYCSVDDTDEQIEAYKLQLHIAYKDIPVEIIRKPVKKNPEITAQMLVDEFNKVWAHIPKYDK